MLNIPFGELYNADPAYLAAKLSGYQIAETKQERRDWEIGRMISYHAVLPHMGRKKIGIKGIWPFPWDEKDKAESSTWTAEQIEYVKNKRFKEKTK